MSWLGNILTGGAQRQTSGDYQQAQKAINTDYGKGISTLTPWEQLGYGALQRYQTALQSQANAPNFLSGLTSHFQMSPYQQFQLHQGEQAIDQNAAATGMLGSGAEMKALDQYAQNTSGADLNDWLNQALQLHSQYLSGLSGLGRLGFSAAGGINQDYAGEGSAMAQLMAQQAQQQAQEDEDAASGEGGLVGDIASIF